MRKQIVYIEQRTFYKEYINVVVYTVNFGQFKIMLSWDLIVSLYGTIWYLISNIWPLWQNLADLWGTHTQSWWKTNIRRPLDTLTGGYIFFISIPPPPLLLLKILFFIGHPPLQHHIILHNIYPCTLNCLLGRERIRKKLFFFLAKMRNCQGLLGSFFCCLNLFNT